MSKPHQSELKSSVRNGGCSSYICPVGLPKSLDFIQGSCSTGSGTGSGTRSGTGYLIVQQVTVQVYMARKVAILPEGLLFTPEGLLSNLEYHLTLALEKLMLLPNTYWKPLTLIDESVLIQLSRIVAVGLDIEIRPKGFRKLWKHTSFRSSVSGVVAKQHMNKKTKTKRTCFHSPFTIVL